MSSADPQPNFRFLNAGDTALIAEFGDTIDKKWVNAVNELRAHITALHAQGKLRGLQETVPTFRSLAIVIDPLLTSVTELRSTLDQYPIPTGGRATAAGYCWRLPVCYDSEFGPDLKAVAAATNLTVDEVIQRHLAGRYQVYTLGFQPGYGFLGDTDERLHLPRRPEPRVKVPAGSVAIAMKLTCVYPWDSPGGWHLLGRCPVSMFDPQASRPTLLFPGDKVRFEPINANDLQALERDKNNGVVNWSQWRERDDESTETRSDPTANDSAQNNPPA